ncbi:DUF5710 domain-containing protein [Noviherbaspirillum galbum]|uniref:DUF5710 domain-containing protein n=1 Tax=Noviherbaspirillum galbum TaxID=2709383 RepID=A0A6B3SLH8_9BURK|nr:DUF5710 domain-containing protein [Noviherbaspirillum galbum]NEX59496.1 hypothetical protein [Noviherbaspirillum galbum]
MEFPPFDPPYFSVERTELGVQVISTHADGRQVTRMAAPGDAEAALCEFPGVVQASAAPKKPPRASAAMPAGSRLLAVPFAEKDAAKKLGARWNPDQKSWYVPPGLDLAPFERWMR